MSQQDQEGSSERIASWYLWSLESKRTQWKQEHRRSRFYHVKYSRYPQNVFELEDQVKDVAKVAVFRYDIGARLFYLELCITSGTKRYGGLELTAFFKIQMHGDFNQGEIEIKNTNFYGPNAKLWNYAWRYRTDPYKMPFLPQLVPGEPDIVSSPMFSSLGVIHKQYPKMSIHHYRQGGLHHYPHFSTHWYTPGDARREGLPSALPKFSSAGPGKRWKASKLRKREAAL
jgi:hypothetical protein